MPPSREHGRTLQRAAKPTPSKGHTHFSTAVSFRSRPARLIKARSLLKCYLPTLPLLCRPGCHPSQLAVRDSHVISVRQTHDLGKRCLRYRTSHTLHGGCHFRPTMFHSIGLPARYLHRQHHSVQELSQGFLLGSGTHTRRYTLKLSKDLTISGECQSVQVSPLDPAPFLVS